MTDNPEIDSALSRMQWNLERQMDQLRESTDRVQRLTVALQRIQTIACDYSMDERKARSDIANIARQALGSTDK